nr:diguanylate cyclase [uncultured Lachnoclostridium sp.]
MIFMPGPMEREQGENKARILIQSISRILLRMGLDQSCSIGITQIRKDGGTFDRAYRKADEALYRAKTSGKNMFCWRDGDGEEWGCRNGEEGTIL